MTDKLPPQLLALFAPRPPLRWVQPVDHAPGERQTIPVSGLAQFLPALKEFKDNDGFVPTESWLQRRERKAQEHKAFEEKKLTDGPRSCESYFCRLLFADSLPIGFLLLARPFFLMLTGCRR